MKPALNLYVKYGKMVLYMVDDVLINKAATIERCIKRVREEYAKAGANFATDYSRQDAAILNIQRACEAAKARQAGPARHLHRL